MFVIPQRVAAAAAALFLCASVTAVARPAIAADDDGGPSTVLETAAISAGRPVARPQPTAPASVASGVPAMRSIEADEAVSGSEPDPETFDRHGLEVWWQGHMQKKP